MYTACNTRYVFIFILFRRHYSDFDMLTLTFDIVVSLYAQLHKAAVKINTQKVSKKECKEHTENTK